MINLLKKLWIRLTWAHVISVAPKTNTILEDNKWYEVHYFIRKQGKNIQLDDITINGSLK